MEDYLHIPTPPLSSFIESIYYYSGYSPSHRIEKLLPEGVIEIIVDLTETPKRLFNPDDFSQYTYYKRSWISGERDRHIIIEAAPDLAMVILRFRPGGAYPFFRFPLAEITNHVLALEDVIGPSQADELRSRILEAVGGKAKTLAAEQFLRSCTTALEPDPLLQYAIERLQHAPSTIPVATLANEIGITNKHLIDIFRKKVGLRPKVFSRIMRFQKVMHLIHKQREVDWADVAFRCGYYDQAHFIKDFQAFSGIAPTDFLSYKGEYINYLPVG